MYFPLLWLDLHLLHAKMKLAFTKIVIYSHLPSTCILRTISLWYTGRLFRTTLNSAKGCSGSNRPRCHGNISIAQVLQMYNPEQL